MLIPNGKEERLTMTDVNFRLTGTPACLVCNAPLPFHQARNNKLCGRIECDWRYSLLQKQNKLCKKCGRPLAIREQHFGVCAAPECQRAAIADRARQEHEQRERWYLALREKAERLRNQVMGDFGIRNAKSFRLAVIPASLSKITRLPAKRRREFRNYLKQLIDRVFAAPVPVVLNQDQNQTAPLADKEIRLQAASGQACACCQGSCCGGGAFTYAYLEAATLQRYRTAHPDQRSRKVLAAYMSYVGDETTQGSCVYHQADGCSLPRDMRSDICNNFYCGGLQDFRQNTPVTGPVRGFFIAATENTLHRAALVHEDHTLMIPVSSTDMD